MPETNAELEQRLRDELSRAVTTAPRFAHRDHLTAETSPRERHLQPLVAAAAVICVLSAGGVAGWMINQDPEQDPSPAAPQVADPRESAAAASPTNPDQAALDDALALLDDWADVPGYAGAVVRDDGQSIAILWAGEVPDDLARLDGETVEGVPVTVVPVAYSTAELQAAARDLTRAAEREGVHVAGTGPDPDRAGLEVVVNRVRSTIEISSEEDALRTLQPLSRVPISDVSFGGGVGAWPGPSAN